MLEIKNLNKKYGSGKVALKSVNLTLPSGQIVGLFGENGAGKTTMMKSILGFLKYDGEITLDGEKITHKNIARISFATSEHSFFPALTPEGHKEFYKEHFDTFREKRFSALMEFFELPMRRRVGSFSTGQKNQFEVLLALSQGADYILMDEPFAGNDVFNREDFYKVLLGILEPAETVLLSTHLIEEVADFIGRAVLLHKGEIIGDLSLDEIEESEKSLIEIIKETYRYRADRVGKAIARMEEES
jgi:ABC-2 type transport system ATP-binding protein